MNTDETIVMLLRTLTTSQCSLRDRIATEAMHAMLARSGGIDADRCYALADAMLRARMEQA